ncbi:ABC transporter ATP-binding protein [Variovorax rhizosphaerae]|uniref:Spermidine/putrescine import ATP-binding protein PotA n=1 Tax=Variovorax rhizosphaerae TaxID=1836200 RepID=A0ABU8WR97_9BURK
MANLNLVKIGKRYPTATVVDNLDLEVADGEMVALLGPSGCGKTTTLRMVAGFVAPTAGQILIGGKDVTTTPAYKRDTGMVFQSYALFPHISVFANVAFGLEMRGIARAEREVRVKKALDLVQLGHLGDRMPKQLSGGQQQRVALARALVVNPSVFLLDEPLSNLDAKLRNQVRLEIRALQQRLGLTTLLVTHDQEEALTMADRLVVMAGGHVQQVGTPEQLYEHPTNSFVAGFVGRCNLLEGAMAADGEFQTSRGNRISCVPGEADQHKKIVAVRPERMRISATDNGVGMSTGSLEGTVSSISYLGAQTEYVVAVGGDDFIVTHGTPSSSDPLHGIVSGSKVFLQWDRASARLLSE